MATDDFPTQISFFFDRALPVAMIDGGYVTSKVSKFSDGLREPRASPFRFFPRKRRWVDREVKIFKMKQAAKKKAEKMTGAADRFTQSKTSTNT